MTTTTLIAPDLIERRIDLNIPPEDVHFLSAYITATFGLAFDFRETAIFIAERPSLHDLLASSDTTQAAKIAAVHDAIALLFFGRPWDEDDPEQLAAIRRGAPSIGYGLAD